MKTSVSEKGKYKVIGINGRIDTANYEYFDEEVKSIIKAGEKYIVFDMQELTYISSSGLRVFLSSQKKMKENGGEIVLCNLNENIKNVFEVSGFVNFFRVENDLSFED